MKEQPAKLHPADVGQVVVLTAGMLLIKLTFFPHRLQSATIELELFNCVLFHRTKFEFSFFFTVTVLYT